MTRLGSPGLMGAGGLEYLIAVVVGGGIIFGIFSSSAAASKKHADRLRRFSTAKQVSMAAGSYLDDNDDFFPPFQSSSNVSEKLRPYFKDDDQIAASRSYTWNGDLSGLRHDSMRQPYLVWMFYTPTIGNGDIVVATAATNVSSMPVAELGRIKKKSGEELLVAKQKHP